jgi:DNA mismatch repair protein PMS2
VVGQFNAGFLVAGLGRDLFILDQHACDEKATFERLLASTTLHEQRLLVPRPLELTPAEELEVEGAADVFAANGMHFVRSPDGRLALSAAPFSKGTSFDVEDVRELASILVERGGRKGGPPLRLPKIRTMLASRACRSAVMIGTPLKRDAARKIVGGMAGLDAPWACPHGRPTMRHLVDTGALRSAGEEGDPDAPRIGLTLPGPPHPRDYAWT